MTTAKLTVTTSGDCEIVIKRLFDAPRDLVFDCYTKPELLKRWLKGPKGWSLAVCDNDLRVGGKFRWVWRGDGHEMSVGGEYREIVRPERIVRTELFDQDWTGGETLGTLELKEQDGKTVLTMTVLYSSAAARDGVLKSGMAEGVSANFDKLETLLSVERRNAA